MSCHGPTGTPKAIFDRRIAIGALLISLVALVTAQFRPLHEYFDNAKLVVNVSPEGWVRHDWGSVSFMDEIQVRNDGFKRGTLTKVEILIESMADPTWRRLVSAKSFISAFASRPGELRGLVPWEPGSPGFPTKVVAVNDPDAIKKLRLDYAALH
jgi:hypothetical protein